MHEKLRKIPFIKLANLPTPLEFAPRLADHMGLTKLLIKRDDLTGFAGGGNKARKLEYDFAEIISKGYDTVITAGGIQSNHARMTAAAARKLGLDVKLVLGGPDYITPKGNLLLDAIFNAEIRYLIDDDANDKLTNEMYKWADELSRFGKYPIIIPIGGSTALGSIGYVKAMQELALQFGNEKVQIVIGVGSCGTFSGTLLGCKLFMPNAKVIGISISRKTPEIKKVTAELLRNSTGIMGIEIDTEEIPIECYDEYYGEYGALTAKAVAAISDCANLEGILLDPVYTGKVMAGLRELTRENIIDKNVPVIFLHTGGTPIIFSFETELSKDLQVTKIYPQQKG